MPPKTKNARLIEDLKIAAAYKLWKERGCRNVTLNERLTYNGKHFRAKVIARDKKGRTYAVECATSVRLDRLHKKVTRLRACLPPNSHIIAVFPQTDGKIVEKVNTFVDEVWVL
jgi:hypothetical protein